MVFLSLLDRTSHKLLFDPTGFAFVSGSKVFYAAFDKRYLDTRSSFSVSLSYLNTFFSNLRNIDLGFKAGFFTILHVKGIGFKVFRSMLFRALYFFLGYNHVTKYSVTPVVTYRPLKGHILLFSFLKTDFGYTVFELRNLRFPDPYRGKGIRYRFQLMRFKPGKQR